MRLVWLRSWPMLVAMIVFVAAGIVLLKIGTRPDLGLALIALAAVCLGSWITLLASSNYSGRSEHEDRDQNKII